MKIYLVLFLALISAVVVSSWSPSHARCPKPLIQYGFIRKGHRNVYTSGRRILIACRSGYKLIGHSKVRCLSSGQWHPRLPYCKKRTTTVCSRLPAPANGKIWLYGSIAKFGCYSGYILKGSSRRYCTSSGWTGNQPTCVKKAAYVPSRPRCPRLPPPANGKVWMHGSFAKFKCYDGYILRGSSIRRCTSNGWTGSVTTCQTRTIQCPRLAGPENGGVKFQQSVGSTAVYTCNRGCVLIGSDRRTCQQNGVWSGQQPTCKSITCPKLLAPRYGSVQQTGNTYGARAVYQCNNGFQLDGNTDRNCLLSGQWSGSTPTCKPNSYSPLFHPYMCKHPYSPEFGSVYVKGFGIGSVAQYSCSQGYKLIGYKSIPCVDGGIWKYRTPYCSPQYH